jgi:hypothetical protein
MLKHLLLAAAVAFTFHYTISMLDFLGYFQRVYNHLPGRCHKLTELEFGSEDIQVLPNGLALISSGLRMRHTDIYNRRPGRIYLFDFNQPQLAPQELTIKADKDYKLVSPHGIYIWTDPKTSEIDLYVTSHQPVETIDKFRFDPETRTLTLLKHLAGDPNVHSLNDILVVDNDQFYFTNFYYTAEWFELPLGIRWGSVGFYDGTKTRLVETGMYGPNSMALSPDRRFLYLSVYADCEVRVYQHHDNHSLTLNNSIKVSTKVDNLNVDMATGDLWLAAHPVTYKTLRHLDDLTLPAPSQVMRMKVSADGKATLIEEILSDDGNNFSTSSVAVVYGKQLLVGSITGPPLYCQLD